MKDLMRMYAGERTNNHFYKVVIYQIKFAHRVKEYIDPDEYDSHPRPLNKKIKQMFDSGDLAGVINPILNEEGIPDEYVDDNFFKEADEFVKMMYGKYMKKERNKIAVEKAKLQKRLSEIEEIEKSWEEK